MKKYVSAPQRALRIAIAASVAAMLGAPALYTDRGLRSAGKGQSVTQL